MVSRESIEHKLIKLRSMFFFDILGGVSCLAMMFIHPEEDDFHRQMSIVLPLAGKFALTGKKIIFKKP